MSAAEDEVIGKKKLLMMGLSEAGKTTIRRVVMSGQAAENFRGAAYDATLDYEREAKVIAGESLSVIDIGGQESFLEKYTGNMAQFAFSDVASLIFVVDTSELARLPRSKYYFDAALVKLDKFSPEAKVFCFLHKIDLIEADNLQSTLDMVKSMMMTDVHKTIEFYQTSIYDGSVFSAMSEAVSVFLHKKEEIQASMKRFAEKYRSVRIAIYTQEGIPITTYGRDSSTWQVNEKMLFGSMFRIMSQIEPTETFASGFIIGRNHYIFEIVVDENTLLSAATGKTTSLDHILADVYSMRDEIRNLIK